jgi:hypothetical protein
VGRKKKDGILTINLMEKDGPYQLAILTRGSLRTAKDKELENKLKDTVQATKENGIII